MTYYSSRLKPWAITKFKNLRISIVPNPDPNPYIADLDMMRLSFFLFAILFPYHIFSQTESKTSSFIRDTVNNRKVYLVVDKAPETSMEFNRLSWYITENNFWPAVDTSCWFTKIHLSFIVEPNGSVSNAKVENRGGFCDDPVRDLNNKAYMEASLKNSLSKLRWTPGELKGQKVPVLITIPIHVDFNFD